MTFSDTREASEESALYGTPDEIAEKLARLRKLGVEYVLMNGGGLVGMPMTACAVSRPK